MVKIFYVQKYNNYFLAKIFLADSYKIAKDIKRSIKILKQIIHSEYKFLDERSKKMTHLKLVQSLSEDLKYNDI